MIPEQPVSLALGADLRLEARLALPDSPNAGVVICHPHPLYGGDMHNPVVVRVQEVCAGLGLATLRFNFRGVGGSSGTHGGGAGEQEDATAALDTLAKAVGAAPLAIAGYSFGAWIAAVVGCRDARMAGLALISVTTTFAQKREPSLRIRQPSSWVWPNCAARASISRGLSLLRSSCG